KKDLFFMIPIIWLLVGPIASALTTEDIPNIQRALFMLPGFQILEAYGIYYTFKLTMGIWRKLFIIILVLAFLLNIIYFFHQYIVHSPSYVAYRRDDGTEQLFQNLVSKENNYKAIYLSSYQDLPLYYYYLHPQNVTFPTYNQKNIDKGMRVGKYIFVPDECPERIVDLKILKSQKSLIVDFGTCTNSDSNLHNLDSIIRHDGTTAYIIKTTN
ncbi:MAG TPA: hypothetical protein VF189_02325, partial [Patescibacteria group bacterium]